MRLHWLEVLPLLPGIVPIPGAGRIHPALMNAVGIRADGDVFFNEAEVRSGPAGAHRNIRLAAILVRERPSPGHAHAVFESARSQGRVPSERTEPILRACLIGKGKQLLRGALHRLEIGVLRIGRGERTRQGEGENERDHPLVQNPHIGLDTVLNGESR